MPDANLFQEFAEEGLQQASKAKRFGLSAKRCSSRGDQRGSGCRSLPLSGAERSSFEFYSEKYFRQPLSGASNFIQTRFGL